MEVSEPSAEQVEDVSDDEEEDESGSDSDR
jgi:hypothetical protein